MRSRRFFEHSQGLDIAYRAGRITAEQMEALARPLAKNGYGQYLLRVLSERVF